MLDEGTGTRTKLASSPCFQGKPGSPGERGPPGKPVSDCQIFSSSFSNFIFLLVGEIAVNAAKIANGLSILLSS